MTDFPLPGPPHIQQQQARANGNRAIGHIESRKVMLSGVRFNEIGHRAVDNSIIQVSARASQDEP
jgi:hypothetical protein